MLIVQKYGGTSVGDASRIRNVARRVVEQYRKGNQMVVVVSAMGDSTDDLIDLSRQITDNPSPREMDMLLSTGEQVSIALLAMAIKNLGVDAVSLTGPQAGIKTDACYSKSRVTAVDNTRLKAELAKDKIVIVAGFQGLNEYGDITTLGRGGSDTTAVVLAAALQADLCEIFTDVDGVYTTDPRIVPEACKLETITYDEMLELAHLGAAVLHPRAVECAKLYNIPLHVRCSFNDHPGTIVKEETDMEKSMVITGVTYTKNVAKLGIFGVPDQPGIAYMVFKKLADNNISVDMIVQSSMRDGINDISFTVAQDDLRRSLETIEEIIKVVGAQGYTHDADVAMVSVVGAGMNSNPGVAAMMFGALADVDINIEMISTSDIKISCIVKNSDAEKAVKILHSKFGLDKAN
ncbi:aspartate kinase [Desulfallas thermosapovorans]|uniref:Aspartokinase n=1 Tax=Desulfallas thermosapovorans DSM 6562 TaxID=1121431 RepID=A0A5S4ZSC2_9FIRM|nr:aspartate kinase [Desulfallas thermosapovorans]TYO95548.1 aspartate kinase [Desulfallas thermosapovorans DSM 6562]